MPPINGLITPTTTNVAAETIRTMHAELADAGLPIRSRTFQHANARTGDRRGQFSGVGEIYCATI